MKKHTVWSAMCLLVQLSLNAQNIGVGTTTPVANLMVNSNGNFNNPQLLLRQTNSADYARMRLQTGSMRYWDIAGFNGAGQINDRLNFYHSVYGDIMTMAGNGFVGIHNSNPQAPLSFASAIGRKIILYPANTGNVGIGVYNNELRMHTDYEPADITFGFENLANVFTERFRFKGNGAFVVAGNAGASGQFLRSNGPTAAPTWANESKTSVIYFNQSGNTAISGNETEVAGLSGTFFVSVPSTVVFGANMNIVSTNTTFTSYGYAELRIIEGISNVVASARSTGSMDPLRKTSLHPTGAIALSPGTYTIKGYIGRLIATDLAPLSFAEAPGQVWVQVIPN